MRGLPRMLRLLPPTAMLTAIASLGAPASAFGATTTDRLTVTATVQSSCALNGGTLAFGTYLSGQTTHLDAVGRINYVNCSGTLTFELDGGQSGDVNNRVMLSGSNQLRYQLYRNASRSAVWGLGNQAQQIQLLMPLTGTVDVFGRIPSGQAVAPGSYSDTVNITLTF